MSMFNLKEVSEEVKGGGVNETYIYPGIRNNVVISKWSHGTSSQKGTPFIAVHLVTKEGKAANVEPKQFEFYVSEKAIPDTLARIKHIVTKVTTNAEWESKEPADLEEMVDHLNDISRGKVLRMKFTGEEYLNGQGEVKSSARIGYPEFAEAVEEGAEYPAVANEDTKLVFDPNNQYDFKKLPKDATNVAEEKPAVAVGW
jgi:hypothetical protein